MTHLNQMSDADIARLFNGKVFSGHREVMEAARCMVSALFRIYKDMDRQLPETYLAMLTDAKSLACLCDDQTTSGMINHLEENWYSAQLSCHIVMSANLERQAA